MDSADLLGAWSLVDWTIEYPDGRITRPFGQDPCGLIVYDGGGWMSAVLMRSDRAPFGTVDMRCVGMEEKTRAFDEYLSYAGRWSLEGSTVRHEVALSLNPLLIGTTQIRKARIERGRLTLIAAERLVPSGTVRRHLILWRRAS